MNSQQSPTSIIEYPGLQSGSEVLIQGAWLVMARVAWVAMTLFSLGLYVAALPSSFAYLHGISTTSPYGPQLTPGAVRELHTLGFSLDFYAWLNISVNILILLVYVLVGIVLFWRKSDDRMALLASFTLVQFSVALSSIVGVGTLPPALALPSECVVFFGNACFALFIYLFPGGRFVPPWTRWLAVGWIACNVINFFPIPPNNSLLTLLSIVPFMALAVSMIAVQIYRYRRVSTLLERQQTKWVVFGFVVGLGGVMVGSILLLVLSPLVSPLTYAIAQMLIPLLWLLIPLSLGFAILRYRLWDIDIIIKRTLVYGILTACVVGIYVLVVVSVGTLLRAQGNFLISLLATGLVAVLFQPLRELFQRGVNRLFYGQRDEPYHVISRLGQRLEAALAPDAALSIILETVAQALKLPYAAITLKQDEEFAIAASHIAKNAGSSARDALLHRPDTLLHLPLLYQSEQVGELLLAPRGRGESFTPADRRLLDDLARQVGIAAHAVRLTADLQQSRERLVTAREEERRRLRRDLHDGLGPALASITLKLDAARNLLTRDPPAADALLVDLKKQTQAAVVDIRRLVYELRPPSLDELGLIQALREQAEQYIHDGLRITIDVPESLPPLPAAVEVATYRIVQEAMTNVVRHAQAHTCTIHLALDHDLDVEIRDDGRGIPAGQRAGVGLTSIRERAAELGGMCEIEAMPAGGTRLHVRLPLPKATEREE